MIKPVKGSIHIVNGNRYGEFETPTKDGYICLFMLDTYGYEYFDANLVEYTGVNENEGNVGR